MNYAEQLKDPRWQKKRLSVLQRDKFTCRECGDKQSTLHVHHMKYEFGKKIFEISTEHLITLCEECHEYVTLINNDMKLYINTVKRSKISKQEAVSELLRCIVSEFPTPEELLAVSWLLEHSSTIDIISIIESVGYGKTK